MPSQAIASPIPTPAPAQTARSAPPRSRNESAVGASDAHPSRTDRAERNAPSFERALDRATRTEPDAPPAESGAQPEQRTVADAATSPTSHPSEDAPIDDAPRSDDKPIDDGLDASNDDQQESASDAAPVAVVARVGADAPSKVDTPASSNPEPDAPRTPTTTRDAYAKPDNAAVKADTNARSVPSLVKHDGSSTSRVQPASADHDGAPPSGKRDVEARDQRPAQPVHRTDRGASEGTDAEAEPGTVAAKPSGEATTTTRPDAPAPTRETLDQSAPPERTPTGAPTDRIAAPTEQPQIRRLVPVATEHAAQKQSPPVNAKDNPASPPGNADAETPTTTQAPGAVQATTDLANSERDGGAQQDALADERLAPREPARAERYEPGAPRAAEPTTSAAHQSGAAQEAQSAGQVRANPAPSAQQTAQGSPSNATPATTPQQDQAAVAVANRGLEVALKQQGGSVQLRLSPESLGAIKVEMTIARGSVAATLQASTPEARELLTRNIETLRSALEAKGLNVERLSITLGPASHGGSSGHSFNANTGSQNPQQNAANPGGATQSHDHDASGERSKGSFEHHERHRHERHPSRDDSTEERLFKHRFGLHAIG